MVKVEKLCKQLHIGYSNFNTTPFSAAAQALVAWNQVGTVPKTPTLQGIKTTGETFTRQRSRKSVNLGVFFYGFTQAEEI